MKGGDKEIRKWESTEQKSVEERQVGNDYQTFLRVLADLKSKAKGWEDDSLSHCCWYFLERFLYNYLKQDDDEIEYHGHQRKIALMSSFPLKMSDPDKFIVPCNIGTMLMGEAICDTGSCINVMSRARLGRFRYLVETYSSMTVELANGMTIKPIGRVDNVIVQVDRLKFPTNFIIIDMADEKEKELLLLRPFLSTAKAQLNFATSTIVLQSKNDYTTDGICRQLAGSGATSYKMKKKETESDGADTP